MAVQSNQHNPQHFADSVRLNQRKAAVTAARACVCVPVNDSVRANRSCNVQQVKEVGFAYRGFKLL